MSHDAPILIATDKADDAKMIERLLGAEFTRTALTTNPNTAVADFEAHKPSVLLLAFDSLAKCERYYLGLYRHDAAIQAVPHRTVILCNKDDVRQVYTLCRKDYFDDYVLFWPMGHDATRLLIAVHHALRHLAALTFGQDPAGAIADKVRQLGALDQTLERHAAAGRQHADDIAREIERLQADGGEGRAQSVASSLQPVQRWAGSIAQELAPPIAAIQALNAAAASVRRVALIVDDDEFQRKLMARMLGDAGYEPLLAACGVEALALLGRRRADIVLMDIDLPDLNGVDVTRRIKAAEHLAAIPVLMITGHSDKAMVMRCVEAGSAGFLVKPLNREALLAKVARCFEAPRAEPPPGRRIEGR